MILIDAIAGLANTVVSRLFPDKSAIEKKSLELEIQAALIESDLVKGQLEINKAEASNPNLFVAGWRPWIGWGLGTILILYAFIYTGCSLGESLGYDVIPLSPMDPMVRDIVLGLLGLGQITRSFEKIKGIKK